MIDFTQEMGQSQRLRQRVVCVVPRRRSCQVKQFYYVADEHNGVQHLASPSGTGSDVISSFENEVFLMRELQHAGKC